MRKIHLLLGALLASLAAAAVVVAIGTGSSHREAPLTSADPTADDTDVYAFTAKDKPGSLTVVANWVPFEDPGGGPNFYRFDDRARYYINIDNTGDGDYDIRYRFDFRTKFNKKNFLHSVTPVTGLNDSQLFQRESYEIVREKYNSRGRRTSAHSLGRKFRAAPSNVGPKTMPDYEALSRKAIKSLPGGGKVFAGQRDDAFFIALDRVFDSINLDGAGTGNQGGGIDTVAGYGVQTIALQIPEKRVTRNRKSVSGPKSSNATVGVWASTERQRLQVTDNPASKSRAARAARRSKWVQVSRLANPLVNELFVPQALKDKYNRTQPSDDLKNFGKFALNPFLAKAFNQLLALGAKEKNRTDIVTALFTGIKGVNQISKKPAVADTLKLNMGVPPSATENRFGVIGGDSAGFPNGRRLADDAVDIQLRVVGGFLVPPSKGGKKLPLGDGVDANDQAFMPGFPYVPSLKNEIGGSPTEDLQTPPHAPTPADAPR
jgi:hypothetical protein